MMLLWASRAVQRAPRRCLFFRLSFLFSFLSALVSHSTQIKEGDIVRKGFGNTINSTTWVFKICVWHISKPALVLSAWHRCSSRRLFIRAYSRLQLQFPTATMPFLFYECVLCICIALIFISWNITEILPAQYMSVYVLERQRGGECQKDCRVAENLYIYKSQQQQFSAFSTGLKHFFYFGCTFPRLKNKLSFRPASRKCTEKDRF